MYDVIFSIVWTSQLFRVKKLWSYIYYLPYCETVNEHYNFKIYGVNELEQGCCSTDRETLIRCYVTCPYGPSSASVASTVAIIVGKLSSDTNIVF